MTQHRRPARHAAGRFPFASLPAVGLTLLACAPVFAGVRLPQDTPAAPAAATQPQQFGQVSGRATWDEAFVYFAFQVEDPDIQGTNKAPMSNPEADDSVGVYLQVGKDTAPDAPNANTHAMIVSAAQGFTFLKGEAGKFVPRPLFTIKYAVSLQGTLNRSDSRDQGYTVEMAIPWKDMGIDGKAITSGTEVRFNIVVRSRGKGLSSLSEGGEAGIAAPSRWQRLILAGPEAAASLQNRQGYATAPRVDSAKAEVKPPLIDGVVRTGEWPSVAASGIAFNAPEETTARPATPVVAAPVPTPPVAAAAPPPPLSFAQPIAGMERLIMARYLLGFQGDPRRPIGYRGVRNPETGEFLLSDQPAMAAGPWFSSDRLAWHGAQLAEMRRSGIDVALTVLGGPDGPSEMAAADDKALLVMSAALRQLSREGIGIPRVALWLDTAALTAAGAPKPDLSTPEGRALLYRAVRRWMAIVPADLRARVTIPPDRGGVSAYPVFLSDLNTLTGVGTDWAEDLRRRFAADPAISGDAAGATVIFASVGNGGVAADALATSLAASLPGNLAPGKGTGAVPTFVVQPGLDVPGNGGTLVSRRDGATYRDLWQAALADGASWIIIDSWNDWQRGTEIASSRQYGPRYADDTRIFAIQQSGLRDQDAKWLEHNLPRRIRSGEAVNGEVIVLNAGTLPLSPGSGVRLSYRWYRGDTLVGESLVPVPLPALLLPTRSIRLGFGLVAIAPNAEGRLEALPPGEYVVKVDLATPAAAPAAATQTASVSPSVPSTTPEKLAYFGDSGDTPLSVPVTVTAEAEGGRAEFAGTDTPALLRAGGSYPVAVRLRWRGEKPLAADAANLTYEIQTTDGKTIATGSAPLGGAVPPGQWAAVNATLRLADTGGAPLPAANPEAARVGLGAGQRYVVKWALAGTQSVQTIPGEFTESVAVYESAGELAGLRPSPNIPKTVEANALVPMEVTITNRGTEKWAKRTLTVGYHWYFPDGVEAVWKPDLTVPIDKEVEPGKSVTVSVPVRVPERDGPYVLAFDAARLPQSGPVEDFLSTHPLPAPDSLGLVYLRVTGGNLTFVDLSTHFNTDAVASEAAPGDGDLDGAGATLPAESFPPDGFGLNAAAPPDEKNRDKTPPPAYPSGYYTQVSPTARLISFRYGPDADSAKNAVSCAGQVIEVPKGRYVGLHLAAVATGTGEEDRPLPVTLTYKDGTTETVTRPVGHWNRAPRADEAVAIRAERKRTANGDVRAVAAVRHIIVPVAPAKELASVTLPTEGSIKVFAVTLER